MPSSAPIGPARMRLFGATITLPPQQSGLRKNFSASGEGSSIAIMRSSTVPQADTTKALLICANAWLSTVTRFFIGSPLTGKWFGQLITWMRVPSAVSANTASGSNQRRVGFQILVNYQFLEGKKTQIHRGLSFPT